MSEPWRTRTVIDLCESMREAQDYSAAPILADALQDADYPDDTVLEKLRDPHVALWLVEMQVAGVYSEEGKAAAEWVANYANSLGPGGYPGEGDRELAYDTLMNAARTFVTTGASEFNSMVWSNASCDEEYEEFWRMYGVITGAPFVGDTGEFFACEC